MRSVPGNENFQNNLNNFANRNVFENFKAVKPNMMIKKISEKELMTFGG